MMIKVTCALAAGSAATLTQFVLWRHLYFYEKYKAIYGIMGYRIIWCQMALKKGYDKDNENHIGRKIILASKTIQYAFDLELRDKVGITLAQWRAINILTTANGITQREIAEKLGLDASSLIPLIDRLETKELVKRKSDQSDRRINRLYLTNRAESLVALSVRKSLTRNITEDQLEVTQLVLNRICQNLINHYGLGISDKPVERSINNLSSKGKLTLPNPKK